MEELEKCCVRGDKDEVKELHPGLSNMGVTDQSNYDGVLSPAQAADGDSEHEWQSTETRWHPSSMMAEIL